MAAQSQPVGANASTVSYPRVPRALIERKKWLVAERRNIERFAVTSKKVRGIPDLSDVKNQRQLERILGYLDLLEFDTTMSPELKNGETRIELLLNLFFNRPGFFFPEDVKQRAERLLHRFQAENWGVAASASDDDEEEEGGEEGEERDASPATANAPDHVTVRLPPLDHEIWGEHGIMRGIAVTQNGKKKLDPRYHHARRSAKVSGHNGLDVGAWFPTRLSALVNGAHGASRAGITGNTDYGAFSIVVATTYKEVDDDRGDTIWYSSPGSAENEDSNAAPQRTGTGHLQRSLTTSNPVRVLRAVNKHSAYAPSVGIRYDGLYVVIRQETGHNPKGGLYFKYLLERRSDQKRLEEVMDYSPTRHQMADYRRINDLW
ncbi:hypothetical protein DHEL01_v210680 [Diaporthe helianthi]|nr:hypothetical protein DHEL01_v210680 [Diaporthe helianthi]